MGIGTSYGAVTVINAIPCGIGSTIGVDLVTKAEFIPGGSEKIVKIVNDPSENDFMARTCVRTALEHISKNAEGWTLTIDSEIPISKGLKSSSSACNAIISAVLNEYGREMNVIEMIRMGVKCARLSDVTVTGAFDDACGCHLGGLVVTDNETNRIVSIRDIDEYDVVIHIPDGKTRKPSIQREMFEPIIKGMETAIECVHRDPFKAMTLNGSMISSVLGGGSVAETALKNGALAAGLSGTGPATAAIIERGKGKKLSEKLGNSIVTRTRGLAYDL